MKKLFRGFAAFLTMLSIAFAVSAKTVDMSEFASGDGWKKFEAALVADKLMAPGADRFQTVAISNAVYTNVLDAKQQASISPAGFHALNMVVNDLPPVMTVREFTKRAGNLKLPDIQVVAQATAARATSGPVQATPVVTADNVEQQLKVLSQTTDSKFTGINRRVEELRVAYQNAVTKGEVAKIVAETQAIKDLSGRVTVVEKEVGELKTAQTTLTNDMKEVKGALEHPETGLQATGVKVGQALQIANEAKAAAGSSGLWTWAALAASALAILLALIAWVATRGKATKTEVVAVMKRQTDSEAESGQLRSDLSDLDTRVKAVEGKRQVVFPDNFDQKVDSLTATNPSYEFSVTVEGEPDTIYTLRITRREEGSYNIAGLKDVTTEVGRKGLRKAIGNAAAVIDSKSRLVGLPALPELKAA